MIHTLIHIFNSVVHVGPRIKELQIFKVTVDGELKNIRVIKKTSNDWEKLGDILGCEPDDLENIRTKRRENPESCCRDVFCEWLVKGAIDTNYPMNWSGVVALLEDCDHRVLADELKEALGIE